MLLATFFSLIISPVQSSAQAIAFDFKEPLASCDRLLNTKMKAECLKIQRSPSADAYLTSICELQRSNEEFLNCLKLSEKLMFEISELSNCQNLELGDQARIECLKKLSYQNKHQKNRRPANHK